MVDLCAGHWGQMIGCWVGRALDDYNKSDVMRLAYLSFVRHTEEKPKTNFVRPGLEPILATGCSAI